MRVFLTGAAGFIGFHAALALLKNGCHVHGFDSLNDYYDPYYKQLRLSELAKFPQFSFTKGLLEDELVLAAAYKSFAPTHVLHLAAQAGVRYSIVNPHAYISANIVGFQNILELVRHHQPTNFVYASSSSVYGGNKTLPFSESQTVANPLSLYAATKLANEVTATAYGNLYGIANTGLRFFTVYGPMGRPDMALFLFADKIRKGEPIPVFNQGKMVRDFTYVDDIVQGILAVLSKPQLNQVYNLGRGKQEELSAMIRLLEDCLGRKAEWELNPMQPGDVSATLADISKASRDLGYQPRTSIDEGVPRFVDWYRSVHKEHC